MNASIIHQQEDRKNKLVRARDEKKCHVHVIYLVHFYIVIIVNVSLTKRLSDRRKLCLRRVWAVLDVPKTITIKQLLSKPFDSK